MIAGWSPPMESYVTDGSGVARWAHIPQKWDRGSPRWWRDKSRKMREILSPLQNKPSFKKAILFLKGYTQSGNYQFNI